MKRTDTVMKLVSLLLFAALTAYVGVYIVRSFTNNVRTVQAVMISVVESAPVSGIVVRDEQIIQSSDSYLSISAEDGKLVGRGEIMATAFSTEAALSRANRIHELELQRQHKAAMLNSQNASRDLTRQDNQIQEAITALASASARHDMNGINLASLNLGSLVIENAQISATQEDLDRINAEIDMLNQGQDSGMMAITAQKTGLFSTFIDGFEFLTPEQMKRLSPDGLRAVIENPENLEGDARMKLSSPFEWYFAAIISEEYVPRLELGRLARLDFGHLSTRLISAVLVSISEVAYGERVVVFRSTEFISETLHVRKAAAEVIFDMWEGIRVPKRAVYSDERGTYVYTLIAHRTERRNINIIGEMEEYYIAEISIEANALRIGSDIILNRTTSS